MNVGLVDVDSHNFPNLPLMKISAWHKAQGDCVEFVESPIKHYNKVYVSKIFGDEYTSMDEFCVNADEVVFGGTGFAITVEDGKEVYHKDRDPNLPHDIEHIYPDYSLYPELTKNKAIGFLTRGCPNNCGFCPVSEKEGLCSLKVADLSEWWSGQKEIVLMDPNILACKDRNELIQQLVDSKAKIDFTQGLDARFITEEVAKKLMLVKASMWHFAFDFMKNEKNIIKGLKVFAEVVKPNMRNCPVYVLTNYDTCFAEDMWRIKKLNEIGFLPDIRIYRKASLPRRSILRDLQRWCNNRIIYQSTPNFWDYIPRVDGKNMKETYPKHYKEWCEYEKKRAIQ